MSEWKKVKLGEITESCLGKMLDSAKNRGEYQPYLANLNVRWGSFDTENLSMMRFEEEEEERYGIRYGDLIICEGGEPGRCAIWKEQLPDMKIQKALHRVRPKDGLVDNFYLFYWFLHAGKRNWIDQYCTGATIKHLPGIKLKEVIVDLPPLSIQHRIATILSRYDSLIENYQKQIKLLEESAQRLYKEWFIDLRFPGHETTKIVDGVPEGWEKKSIADLGTYLNGFAFKPSDWQETGKPIIKIKEMGNGINADTPRNNGERVPERYLIKSGDLLFSWSATLMVIVWTGEDGWLNQHLFKVTPAQGVGREFLLQSISRTIAEFSNLTTGSTMKHIQRNKLEQVFVNTPTTEIMNCYSRIAERLREQILNISSQIRHLTEARDRLLPKLMSGEIEV